MSTQESSGARTAGLFRLTAACAGLLIALSGCSTGKPPSTASDAPSAPTATVATEGQANPETVNGQAFPAVKLDSATMFQIIAADIAAQRGQPATAYATYMSLAVRTKDPRLARRALEVALREQNADSALESARLWNSLAAKDPQANQSLTILLVARGAMDEAKPRIKARLDADRMVWYAAKKSGSALPEDSPWEQAQRMLIRAPNKFETYQLLLDLFAADAKEPVAQRVLASQAHFAGAHALAVDHAQKLVQLEPGAGSTLLLAQYQQSLPDGLALSIRTLEKYVATDPQNVDASTTLGRLYTLDQQWDKARLQFESVLTRESDNTEVLYILTGLAIQLNDRMAASRFATQYLERAGDDDERDLTAVFLSLAQMAEEDKAYADAVRWLGQVRNPTAQQAVRLRSALIMAKQGQVEGALDQLANVTPVTDAEKVQLALTKAQILREADRLDPAAQVLAAALKDIPDQPDLLYEDAMIAEKQRQVDRAEQNLRTVIRLRPDNPHAYNALGYSLADRNIRLDEAKVLIDKASALAPDDAYIMDSLGWVLYRQGNLREALTVLRKAYAIKADPEIAIHLGEVLWRVGEADEARKFLRAARDNSGSAELLRETLARLGIANL